MHMDKHEIIEILAADIAAISESKRLALEKAKSATRAQIASLDNAWSETERKHQTYMKEATSESWNRSLVAIHKERQAKYEDTRSNLLAHLSEFPVDIGLLSMDFEEIRRILDTIDSEISRYEPTLAVKRRQLEHVGDYGGGESDKWHAEILRFVEKNPSIFLWLEKLNTICDDVAVVFDWNAYVAYRVDERISPAAHLPEPMKSDGIGFEHACLAVLIQTGWEGRLTKSFGDQGVDIIARKNNRSVAIQCKNYTSRIGNGAVQEVHAGKAFYETDFAIVVSPSGFTESAIQLANKLNVLLVDPASLDVLENIL